MEREVPQVDSNALIAISRAEIDGQIATAKAYPRSVTSFVREATELVTLNVEMAEACIYALPRDGKTIAGPSARFAEIIQHSFGNNRGGARVVAQDEKFITAQGVYHDLEKNVQVTMEVQRRITDKSGRTFKADMIGVTGNACCSIAHRNAVLKGIPKALWLPIYEAARLVAVGDITTLVDRRDKALAVFQKYGITPAQVCTKLNIEGVADIGLDQLEILTGLRTAIREGSTTPEAAFAPDTESKVGAPLDRGNVKDLDETLRKRANKAAPPKGMDPKTGEVPASAISKHRAAMLAAADVDALNNAYEDTKGPDSTFGAEELDELMAVYTERLAQLEG